MPRRAPAGTRWEFERFQLIPEQRLLLNDGAPVPLTSKAFDILVLLVENRDRVVTKDELLRGAWPGTIVEEGNLTQQIFLVRKALGESAQQQRCIVTIPGHGYRFTAPVREISSAGAGASEGAERVVAPAASRPAPARGLFTFGLLGAGVLALVGAALLTKGTPPPERASVDSPTLRLTKATETGLATSVTLAPDGGYVAYAETDGDEYRLVVQQLATGGKTQVVAREPHVLKSLTFSPDGYLYFTRGKEIGAGYLLHRVPAIGGPETPILDDVDTAVSFSPDGRQFAFMRRAGLDTHIVVADSDGGAQRILKTRTEPLTFWFYPPAWSPDGRYIAASAGETRGGDTSVVLLPLDGGAGRELYTSEHRIGALRWLPDGSGLVTVVSETLPLQFAPWLSVDLPFSGGSIWRIGYPDGSAERLTPDLDDYDLCCVGVAQVAQNGWLVAGVLNSMVSDVWVAPADQLQTAEQISWGSRMLGRHGWLNDTIVYRDVTGHLKTVRRTDGRELRLALPEGLKVTGGVSVCGQGRYVVFAAVPGHNIWRITPEGGGAFKLTEGFADHHPVCSDDGNWIVFASMRGDEVSTWRLPVEGGAPVQLVEKSHWALPSPRGGMIVYSTYEWDEKPILLRRTRWIVRSSADRSRLYAPYAPADASSGVPINWAPDESGLDYVVTRRGVSNIWRLPLDGGPAKQITHFTAGRILSFAWSPDGAWLSLGSGVARSDVVLISREP